MNRREKMIAILQKYLPDGFTADTFWIADDIPREKVEGARKAYADGVRYEDVLAMTDETIFGGAQRGIVFTEDGYYMNGRKGITRYSARNPKGESSLYDEESLLELLQKLDEADAYGVDGVKKKETSGGLFDSVVNAISDAIDDAIETAEEEAREDAGETVEEETEELTDEEFAELVDECEAYFKKQRAAIRKALSCTDDEFPESLDVILDVLDESEDFCEATDYTYEELVDSFADEAEDDGGDVPEFSMSEETEAMNEALENAVDDLDRAVGAARISEIVESAREVLEDHVDRIREVLVFLKSFKEEEE